VLQRRRRLEEDRTLAETLRKEADDLGVLIEWARQGEDVTADLERGVEAYNRDIQAGEIRTMLSGPLDRKNAIITIHRPAARVADWARCWRMACRSGGFKRDVTMQPER
jgi:peptide chain release factor 2